MNNLPENTVHYYIYSNLFPNDKILLEDHISEFFNKLSGYLKNYIWHNESFNLQPIINQSGSYIYGRCNYGENIEDEWFIVFLLKHLTELDSNLIVRIYDEDGEFLLIESALHLKKWAQEPRQTENRVYLYKGDLHLVSPKLVSEYDNSNNSLIRKCIEFIRETPDQTRCDNSIQDCINRRILNYPDNIDKYHHKAHCYLPIRLASILMENPGLISQVIRAFYFRTPDDFQLINSLKHFKSEKWITTCVRFNRCLYAQMKSQELDTDFQTFKTLTNFEGDDEEILKNGLKITSGFEILICRYENNKKKIDSFDLTSESFSFETNMDLFGKRIHGLLEVLNTDSIHITEELTPADDESWMNLSGDDFENLLNKKFNPEYNDSTKEDDFESVMENFMLFLNDHNAGLDGVESFEKYLHQNISNHLKKFKLKPFKFYEFLARIKRNFADSPSSGESDSDTFESNEEIDSEKDEETEMQAYLKQMDSELAHTVLHKSFEKTTLDSDDSDEEQNIKFNAFSNIIKSIQEETETSSGVGPATTLLAYLNQKIPDSKKRNEF